MQQKSSQELQTHRHVSLLEVIKDGDDDDGRHTTGTEPGDLREWDVFKENAFTPEELENWMQVED